MRNQIFIPTVANQKDDIIRSWKIQKPLTGVGYNPGLMLVVLGGKKGIIEDVKIQYSNLSGLKHQYGDAPIVTMLSNIPIDEINFLHNTSYATEHVKRGVEFATWLPVGGRKTLTFHLNSLVSKEEFEEGSEIYWKNEFHKIIRPALKDIAEYAHDMGVEVKIETVPVPEFGDVHSNDENRYRGAKLNELRNPFHLTHLWGFEQIYDTGLGICLDLSHNRTIYAVAREGDSECVLRPSETELLAYHSLFDDVEMLLDSDLVHLNDGEGIYSSERESVFREGVPLGQGDISELDDIITILDSRKIPYVLEIDDSGDFKGRAGTKASIKYLIDNF